MKGWCCYLVSNLCNFKYFNLGFSILFVCVLILIKFRILFHAKEPFHVKEPVRCDSDAKRSKQEQAWQEDAKAVNSCGFLKFFNIRIVLKVRGGGMIG